MKKTLLTVILGAAVLFSENSFSQNISVDFTGMTPHIGQKFEARLISKKTMKEVDRTLVSSIAGATFSLALNNAVVGESYWVDMYADFNNNGIYDMIPTDHAWRIDADVIVSGMNSIAFAHNTNFDEINWKHELTFNLTNMNPHIGQLFEVRLIDINQNLLEVSRQTVGSIATANFDLIFPALENGHSYYLEFYADFNGNGIYDAIPTDHAWRLRIDNVSGDMSVAFSHNTNFSEIDWKYLMTLELNGLTPHLGQLLEYRLVNSTSGNEIGRVSRKVDVVDLVIEMPGISMGESYNAEFYADFNSNGIYDVVPTDHAWRESALNVTGNTTITFVHNPNFVDINWDYLLTFNTAGMTPHLGQLFELRVVNTADNSEVGRVSMDSITTVDFTLKVPGLEIGKTYNVDYYADFNGNGEYNAPTVDHAWRDLFTDVNGDTTLAFSHNTGFTDIMWPGNVGIIDVEDLEFSVYPNPFSNNLTIKLNENSKINSVKLINSFGQIIGLNNVEINSNSIRINELDNLPIGIYYIQIIDNNKLQVLPLVKN